MTSVTCIRCGTVNLVADEVCKVCGTELREGVSEADSDASTHVSSGAIPPFEGPSDGIGPTFRLFTKNFLLITKIILVIYVPLEVFKGLSFSQGTFDFQLTIGLFALQLACNVLVGPALFYALLNVIQTGKAPGINEAYRWSLSKFPKLAVTFLLSSILIILATVLLIVPGIILSLVFAVVYPVAVFEKGSAVDALRRSAELTKGRRMNILGAYIVIWVLVIVVNGVVGTIAAIPFALGLRFVPAQVIVSLVGDVFAEALTVLSLVIYLGILRTLESGRSVIE